MNLAKYIDHTILKANTTTKEVKQVCDDAIKYGFKAVCIPSSFVAYAKKYLDKKDVLVCTVIGFPLGYVPTEIKVAEAKLAKKDGAHEVDMVINISKAKDGDFVYVENEIKAIKDAIGQTTLKVIIETSYLTDAEKIAACKAATKAGANFVKTSTGFSTEGAKVEDVKLMKANIAPNMEVKASGGVRNIEDAQKMIAAGATRIGTSNGITILEGNTAKGGY